MVNLGLPLLAERKGDIPLLAYYFLDKFKTRMNKVVRGISPEAMELLENYAYPGNVRELMNIMERAVALCRGEVIMPHDLPGDLSELELKSFLQPGSQAPTLEELERQYVEHVLTLTGGVRSKGRRNPGHRPRFPMAQVEKIRPGRRLSRAPPVNFKTLPFTTRRCIFQRFVSLPHSWAAAPCAACRCCILQHFPPRFVQELVHYFPFKIYPIATN